MTYRPCWGPWYAEARCVKAVSGCSLASRVFPARSSFPRLSCCARLWNARPPQTVWRDFFAFSAQTHRKRCPKQGRTLSNSAVATSYDACTMSFASQMSCCFVASSMLMIQHCSGPCQLYLRDMLLSKANHMGLCNSLNFCHTFTTVT